MNKEMLSPDLLTREAATTMPVMTTNENQINANIRRVLAPPEGSVIAVHVRQVDPPQFVAEDIEELQAQFPGEWAGEQCDNCGCCAYTIERDPTFPQDYPEGWVARCSGEPDTADEYAANGADPEQVAAVRNGCGTQYRLRWVHESQVAF